MFALDVEVETVKQMLLLVQQAMLVELMNLMQWTCDADLDDLVVGPQIQALASYDAGPTAAPYRRQPRQSLSDAAISNRLNAPIETDHVWVQQLLLQMQPLQFRDPVEQRLASSRGLARLNLFFPYARCLRDHSSNESAVYRPPFYRRM